MKQNRIKFNSEIDLLLQEPALCDKPSIVL